LERKDRGAVSKYGARKTPCNQGHTHDSKREAKRCDELHLLQRAGEIFNLRTQHQFYFVISGEPVKHPNGRRAGFKVDFFYTVTNTLADIAEDSKGFTVRDYPLRAAIFRALFPQIELREV
jgi:hypothetical protein